jgi:hypothetical protein
MNGAVHFQVNSISAIAPKEAGAEKMEIKIDGQIPATVDLSVNGTQKAQQVVYKTKGLTKGKHVIEIINRGSGSVSLDALIVTK